MQVILLGLTCLLISQGATKKQSWTEIMTPIFFLYLLTNLKCDV